MADYFPIINESNSILALGFTAIKFNYVLLSTIITLKYNTLIITEYNITFNNN